MKYAIHTISWGEAPHLLEMLRDIVDAGYSGIELFQHPDTLGGIDHVFDACHEVGVELIGFCCGSFTQRCRFVETFADRLGLALDDPRTPYVYTDDWSPSEIATSEFEAAVERGVRIALHPHMFKPIQTLAEAEALLAEHPSLRFLPDTAHMTIAGDDPCKAIDEHHDRIDAVHVKDWSSDVGRSYQFYARGFCELGDGDIDLESVLDRLLRRLRKCWLVVEQDSTRNPRESAERSMKWLRARLGNPHSHAGTNP